MLLGLSVILLAALASGFFATLTFALRDLSKARLGHCLQRRGRHAWLQPTLDYRQDLIFITATGRLLANIIVVLQILRLLEPVIPQTWLQHLATVLLGGLTCVVFSLALPHAAASHAAEPVIASCVRFLHTLRLALLPVTRLLHAVDRLVRWAVGSRSQPQPDQIEQEILSVVEEGQKEGVVDSQERRMIESVIQFRDTQVGHIMTARPHIVALEVTASLEEVKRTLEESGHSRIPVYEKTLDHIVGVLYARDLLRHLGRPPQEFDIRSAIRPPIFVPETKPLRDLLAEFRLQKVHIAIVLDEYGGTAGLVSIEDILEELVGEISDEHEPQSPAMFRRIDDNTFEADARLPIAELNRQLRLNIPQNADYDTLGGFTTATLGRIPPAGACFEHGTVRYEVLEAEPHRVKRLRITLLPQAVQPGNPA